MKSNKQFVLSDEQTNSYGFKVLTSGIRLDRFRKNPVMLFEHDRKQVIGKWSDITVSDSQLLATPTFDNEDENAVSISKKVEKGYINGASIGLNIIEIDRKGEVPIAVKSEIFESSICAIPSNQNALRVVDGKGDLMADEDIYVTLSLPNSLNLNQELSGILGLHNATQRELLDEVRNLKQRPIDEVINKALFEGKIMAPDKAYYAKLLSMDFEKTKELIESLPGKQTLAGREIPTPNQPFGSFANNDFPSDWTLQDYRKHAPGYLKKNRAFFLELVEFEKTQNNKF